MLNFMFFISKSKNNGFGDRPIFLHDIVEVGLHRVLGKGMIVKSFKYGVDDNCIEFSSASHAVLFDDILLKVRIVKLIDIYNILDSGVKIHGCSIDYIDEESHNYYIEFKSLNVNADDLFTAKYFCNYTAENGVFNPYFLQTIDKDAKLDTEKVYTHWGYIELDKLSISLCRHSYINSKSVVEWSIRTNNRLVLGLYNIGGKYVDFNYTLRESISMPRCLLDELIVYYLFPEYTTPFVIFGDIITVNTPSSKVEFYVDRDLVKNITKQKLARDFDLCFA